MGVGIDEVDPFKVTTSGEAITILGQGEKGCFREVSILYWSLPIILFKAPLSQCLHYEARNSVGVVIQPSRALDFEFCFQKS